MTREFIVISIRYITLVRSFLGGVVHVVLRGGTISLLYIAMMTTDHPNSSKPRRRWLLFSLGSLLVLVTVLCVWLGVTVNRARKQREAVEAIEELGGELVCEYQFNSEQKPPGPEWLRELIGDEYFVTVVAVGLHNTEVTDIGLEHLKGLNNLQKLGLGNTKVTDAGLVHLKGLNNLYLLRLNNTQVTDAGLEHLKGLNNLLWLNLSNTQATDAGVLKLQQALPNCEISH